MAIRVLPIAALVLVCAGCGGHAVAVREAAHSAPKTRSVPGEPGLEYLVRGRFLYLLCEGEGSPTVVFESGLGDGHRAWQWVAPELANSTTVCTYDRAGLDFSQLAPKRATARAKVRDLHALLRAAGLRPPYVLVGHSYGGMLVHVYVSDYPRDVAAVVLLDSSHPDQQARMLAALPPARAGEGRALRSVRAALAPRNFPNPEGVDWSRSSDEARAAGSFGDKPLVVVTAGEHEGAAPPVIARRLERAWLAVQNDLARLSSDSVHVVATRSPHYIQSNLGQPLLVIRIVRIVLHAVRTHTPLPPCRDLFHGAAARCVS
jgi:pimeloyl-ACP methyl ester carboxylesterase